MKEAVSEKSRLGVIAHAVIQEFSKLKYKKGNMFNIQATYIFTNRGKMKDGRRSAELVSDRLFWPLAALASEPGVSERVSGILFFKKYI